jgi:hypothetical protein
MPTKGSVILSEAKDPMHARSTSGKARHSRDADDVAANLLKNHE